MAGVKISALPGVASSLFTDFFPAVQAGVTSQETLTQVATLFGFTVNAGASILNLSAGGTGANLTATNNSLVYSTSSALALLATANNGVLITGVAGAPSISSTLPTAVQSNITQLGTQAQALNMGTNAINNVTDPVNAQDAATKNYVDNIASGGAAPVVAATTGALTVTYSNGSSGVGATLTNAGAQTTFSIDGQSPTVGQRVLIKNQASTLQNGIYTVTNVGSGATNWVLTRAVDYDTPATVNDTGVIPVINGTANANTGWINTTVMVTVGTTAITFVQFGVTYPVSLANGGTGASLTASNGGIFYSTGSAGAILAGTATANQVLLSGSSTTPAWSTATYLSTMTLNAIHFASAANVMGQITPGNNGVLVSSSSGVPSWNTSLGQGLAVASSVLSVGGANNIPFNTGQGIQDNNTKSLLLFTVTASAVNFVNVTNNSTGNPPIIAASGTDSNIQLQLNGKGTSGCAIQGVSTNTNPAAGYVGQIISSQIVAGSAVTVTRNTNVDLTSISLTAGNWLVWGNLTFTSVGTTATQLFGWINTTSVTTPDASLYSSLSAGSAASLSSNSGMVVPTQRLSLSGTTNVFISGFLTNVSGNGTFCGGIYAMRLH